MRNPEIQQTKKSIHWHFVKNVHLGVVKGSGLIHLLVTMAANAHDRIPAGELLKGAKVVDYSVIGYQGIANTHEIACTGEESRVMIRPGKC